MSNLTLTPELKVSQLSRNDVFSLADQEITVYAVEPCPWYENRTIVFKSKELMDYRVLPNDYRVTLLACGIA